MIERIIDRVVEYIEPLAFICLWVITFALIRFIVTPSARTFRNLIASLFVSVPTGVLTGGILKELGYGELLSTGGACLMTIVAHNLMIGLILHNRQLVKYVDRAINNIIDKLTK